MITNSYNFIEYIYYNEVVCSFKVIFLFILLFLGFPQTYIKNEKLLFIIKINITASVNKNKKSKFV